MSATPAYFTVELYHDSGARLAREQFTTLDEARAYAKGSPQSSITALDANGWVLSTDIYTPVHPLPLAPSTAPADGGAK